MSFKHTINKYYLALLTVLYSPLAYAGPLEFTQAPIGNPLAAVHNESIKYIDVFANWIIPGLIIAMIVWEIYKFTRSNSNFQWENLARPVVALIFLVAIRQVVISTGFGEIMQ
jgi:hypothetical protein